MWSEMKVRLSCPMIPWSQVRDEVEQARFAVQPFQLVQGISQAKVGRDRGGLQQRDRSDFQGVLTSLHLLPSDVRKGQVFGSCMPSGSDLLLSPCLLLHRAQTHSVQALMSPLTDSPPPGGPGSMRRLSRCAGQGVNMHTGSAGN